MSFELKRPIGGWVKPWFKVGDKVSVFRWDYSEAPGNRVGSPAVVTSIETDQACETGFMITVTGTSYRELTVDLNWLEPISKEQ